MSRFADALIQNTGPMTGQANPALDLRYGGMNGFSPDFTEWVSAQAYIGKNVQAYVVETPKGFDYLPPTEAAAWRAAYKALIEQHPQSIQGLNSTLEVEVISNAMGASGQIFEDFVKVSETRSAPQFTWIEKYGMSIGNFWKTFIRTFMSNPYSTYPDIMLISGTKPTDHLADLYSGTILFIESDATLLNPVNAFLVTNFWPQGTGEITSKRDLTQAGEARTIDITFSAVTQQGTGVLTFARDILRSIQITGANPTNRPAFINAISEDVLAVGNGYKANVEKLGAQAVKF